MNKLNLEERLINFAVMILEITSTMPDGKAAKHLSRQFLRSGTSPALNYDEAQNGASQRDFIHKIKIVLKELKESNIYLKIIYRTKLFVGEEKLT